MKKIFDYPSEGWVSDSNSKVSKLAIEIQKRAIDMRIEARLLNPSNPFVVGFNKAIQSTGFNIRLEETDYGCQLQVFIFEENEDCLKFQHLWKQLIEEGKVWGGPIQKGFKVVSSHEKRPTNRKLIREIVRKASNYTDDTPPELHKRTIGEIALLVSNDYDYDFVIGVFERAAKKEYSAKKIAIEDLRLENFFELRTLYNWLPKRMK